MLKLKCKMFEESKKSTASENIVVTLVIFFIMLLVIQIVESIIPTIMSNSELRERIAAEGVTDIKIMMNIATEVLMQAKYLIPTLFCTIFGTIISIIYCRFVEARHLSSMGMRRRKAGLHYLQGLGVGFVMISAAALLSALFGITEITRCKSADMGVIGLMLGGFLIQGMSEEVLCRGYFLVSVSRRGKMSVAILLNSLLFAALHLLNPGVTPLAILNLVLFGVFASVYFLKRGNIWGIGAIHTAWNFVQGNLFGISVSGMSGTPSILTSEIKEGFLPELLNGGAFGLEGGLAVTVVLLAATAVMLFVPAKRSEISETGLPSADAPSAETPDEEPSDDGSATQLD